jgi:hypothetical protein
VVSPGYKDKLQPGLYFWSGGEMGIFNGSVTPANKGVWQCRRGNSSMFATLPEYHDRNTDPAVLAEMYRQQDPQGRMPESVVWVEQEQYIPPRCRKPRTRFVDVFTWKPTAEGGAK